jgi:SSS family solute:Na+ symporter
MNPDPAAGASVIVAHAFGGMDWAVVLAYGVVLASIGTLYSRRQRTTEEYFVAGRNQRPFLAGVSIFASLFTLISYLGIPGEWTQHGPIVAISNVLTCPLCYLIVGFFLIPVIMRLPITSAYELLEARLGRTVRLAGSATFVCIRLIWMSLILHTAANVLIRVVGCDPSWIISFKVVIGLSATVIALVGGIDAVMIVTVVDFFVLLLGAVLTLVSITIRTGGIGAWWPRHWAAHWSTEPFASLNPHVRITMLGTCIYFLIGQVCLAGSDQITIQRYLTTRDAAAARRAYRTSCIVMGGTFALMGMVGAAVLEFFQLHPSSLPAGMSVAKNGDACYPYYMGHYLPSGISGLVVAGVVAAAISGLSSGINSVITVIFKDFIDISAERHGRSEASKIRTARWLAFGIGLIALAGSLAVALVRGDLVEVTGKTVNLFAYPMFGLFFLAMFVPYATPFGAIIGAVYSIAAAVLVGYWDVLSGQPPLSFQWMAPTSLAAALAVGCLFSLLPTRGRARRVLAGYATVSLAPLVALIAWLLRA